MSSFIHGGDSQMLTAAPGTSIHRMPIVEQRVGLKRSQIYVLIKRGSFPRPVPLGKRARGWLGSDIDRWIAQRAELAQHGQGAAS
jgi:prophage regulatory protein